MDYTAENTLYRSVVECYTDTESVKDTAKILGISEVKVRRILLTEGLWFSRTSLQVQALREMGKTTEEIAEELHTTIKAVQQYLPYTRGIYMGESRSADAMYSMAYRERIREMQKRILRKKQETAVREGWTMREMNQYPGMVCLRDLPEGLVDWDKVKKTLRGNMGFDVVRLHLELMREHPDYLDPADDGRRILLKTDKYTEEETRVLRTYGNVCYGDTISRDILIPDNMPLYAIHYMIQMAFGWQNSHLHRFELPTRQFLGVTDNSAEKWLELLGVLFRSPWMDEEDVFWADDYETGSFRNWIRKKYNGPYLSLCHGEGIVQCREDIKDIRRHFPFVQVDYMMDGERLRVCSAEPAPKGSRPGLVEIPQKEKERFWNRDLVKREILPLNDCSAEAMHWLFMEYGAEYLLERLEIGEVLALHGRDLDDALADSEEIADSFDAFMDEDLQYDIREILKSGDDSPLNQPVIGTPTDVLYYFYDYGDGWRIRITGSYDVCDLVEAGRVSDREIEEAMKQVYETWRPVCIAADGLPLVDDVGGLSGYVEFLRAIHPTEEKAYWAGNEENRPDNGPYETKQSSLVWAKSLGWKDKVKVERLL